MTYQSRANGREQLRATATPLQTATTGQSRYVTITQLETMAELIEQHPAEAQLIMSALEDGLRLGPMCVTEACCDLTAAEELRIMDHLIREFPDSAELVVSALTASDRM